MCCVVSSQSSGFKTGHHVGTGWGRVLTFCWSVYVGSRARRVVRETCVGSALDSVATLEPILSVGLVPSVDGWSIGPSVCAILARENPFI